MAKTVASFVAFCAVALSSAQLYHLTDLGTLNAGYQSWPLGINDSGQVTGLSYTNGFGTLRPFIWSGGVMSDLDPAGFGTGQGLAINGNGLTVGTEDSLGGFVGTTGSFTTIPGINGGSVTPLAINASGLVAGFMNNPGFGATPFLFSGGNTQFLPTFGFASLALGVNDSGAAVGYAVVGPPNNAFHAVAWSGNSISDLGTLGGAQSFGQAINNSGTIVGFSDIAGNGAFHACSWSNGSVVDLGTLGGTNSSAQAVNSLGQIVGYSDLPGTTSAYPNYAWPSDYPSQLGQEQGDAFITINGIMKDLNSLIDSSGAGYVVQSANGISDGGQIIASALFGAFHHAVLLTPASPPTMTASSSTTTLWPPNGKTDTVTVAGQLTSAFSTIDINSGAFAVADSYGQDQPSGTFAFASDGSYTFTVGLVASRRGGDKAGRAYTITASGKTLGGQTATTSLVISVPHNQ